jgi:hypothetical protein
VKIKIIFILLVISFNIQAQSKTINKKLKDELTKWYRGTLSLTDGTTKDGLIQYNDKIGTLALKSEEGTESYSANTVTKFHFLDTVLNLTRNFISLDYPVEHLKNKIVAPFSLSSNTGERLMATFFEVLGETNQFALLSKIKPIEYKQKVRTTGGYNGITYTPATTTVVEELNQDEILFFLNHEGDMMPYLEIINKESEKNTFGIPRTKKKLKVKNVDSDLLATITGVHYAKLIEFAKTNKLDVEDKEDLVKIIDYYLTLTK